VRLANSNAVSSYIFGFRIRLVSVKILFLTQPNVRLTDSFFSQFANYDVRLSCARCDKGTAGSRNLSGDQSREWQLQTKHCTGRPCIPIPRSTVGEEQIWLRRSAMNLVILVSLARPQKEKLSVGCEACHGRMTMIKRLCSATEMINDWSNRTMRRAVGSEAAEVRGPAVTSTADVPW